MQLKEELGRLYARMNASDRELPPQSAGNSNSAAISQTVWLTNTSLLCSFTDSVQDIDELRTQLDVIWEDRDRLVLRRDKAAANLVSLCSSVRLYDGLMICVGRLQYNSRST